jgi:hypothetical protein
VRDEAKRREHTFGVFRIIKARGKIDVELRNELVKSGV